MLRKLTLVAALLVCGLSGCSQTIEDGPAPITVDQWKTLPVKEKYTREALERLKEGNPTLQTPEGWESFSRTTLVASRHEDFPRSRR